MQTAEVISVGFSVVVVPIVSSLPFLLLLSLRLSSLPFKNLMLSSMPKSTRES
jgi:hypothetical protein